KSSKSVLWPLCVSIAEEIVVSGYEGGEAEISCSYGHGYENYKKYLCNRGCGNSDIVIETHLGVHHTKKGSFSLHDDIKRRVFTVNVTQLTLQHAGIYWCAVSRYGKDIYTEVRLQVVKGKFPFLYMYLKKSFYRNINTNDAGTFNNFK
uniref:Immunoglobulin domain-containing protein n=1 Tax=Oncorhynchus mykiss TaxID=8022 RepID=A0A8C7Q693_ONCMY